MIRCNGIPNRVFLPMARHSDFASARDSLSGIEIMQQRKRMEAGTERRNSDQKSIATGMKNRHSSIVTAEVYISHQTVYPDSVVTIFS